MNTNLDQEFSFQTIEYFGKVNRIQIPEDLIYLQVLDQQRRLIFQIDDFENFDHVSDLVTEELEELQLKGKIFNQDQALNKDHIVEVRSAYLDYQWMFFPCENFYFVFFIGKENRASLCERQFQRLVNFFTSLQLENNCQKNLISKIKDYLTSIINKNKAIKKLELEEFQSCTYKVTLEELDVINMPLENFPEITFVKQKKTNHRVLWTSLTLILLSLFLLIIWYSKENDQAEFQQKIKNQEFSIENTM